MDIDFNIPTIITKRNVDSGGNPISVKLIEIRQIMDNYSCVVLSQTPDEYNRIYIEGFTEVFDIEKLDKKNFKVDYSQGIIYFHPFNIGKAISIEYYGVGYELISASRVFISTDKHGNVIDTLEEILNRASLQLKLVESLGGAIKVIEKLDEDIKNANNLNAYFDEMIPEATGLKNELDSLVTDAKGWKDQLKQDVKDGKVLQPKLQKNVEDAKVLQPLLNNDIEVGTPLQENLHSDIVEANKWKDQLHTDVEEGKTLQPLLAETISSGNTTNQQLNQSITNAQGDIAKIEATGNEIINITSTEWVYNETSKMYEKQITHKCNSENVHITCKTSDTKEGLHLPWKIVDKSNILLKSEEAIGVNVIISARYYKPLTDNTTTQEVIDARKGELTLLDKMNKVDEQLEHIATITKNGESDIDILEKAILEVKNKGGSRLFLPARTFVIDRPLIISNLGIDIKAVPYKTKIVASDNFIGDQVIRFEQDDENLYKGINIEGLYIDCKGKNCHGITFINSYDQCSLRNVEVRNCNDDYICFNFEQNNERVGQTLLIENCIGDHITNTSLKPVWYFNRYQEVNMIGTKAFGSKANMSASGIGYYFVDCKGITMTGCSHSFCSKGVVIEAKNRNCNGFNFIAMNHEEVGVNSIETIVNDSYLIGGLNVWGIRDQNGIGNILLNGVRNSVLFTTYSNVEIKNTCSNVMIISGDKSKVVDNGVNSTIIGSNNALQQQIEIMLGLGLTSSNTPRLDYKIEGSKKKIRTKYSATPTADYGYIIENTTDDSTFTLIKLLRAYASLYSNNVESLRVTTTGTNMTSLMVLANINGVDKLVKVQIGDVDSAGVGFRTLRIPNDI